MNLKKFLSMIMVLSMTAAVFTGCGSSSDSTSDDSAVAGKKGNDEGWIWSRIVSCNVSNFDSACRYYVKNKWKGGMMI